MNNNPNKSKTAILLGSKQFKALSIIFLAFVSITSLFNNCSKIESSTDESSLTIGPKPTLTTTTTSPTTESPFEVTISFNNDIVGLTITDFVVTNGTITNLQPASGVGNEFSVDVTATSWGQVTIVLPAGTSRSSSDGLISAVSNTLSITYGSNEANEFKLGIVDDSKFPFYFRRDSGAFGSSCSILATASAPEDITCTLDLNEGDVWYWGYKLKYQSPPGMCKYLTFYNYYFYNYETGYGPTKVTIYKDNNSVNDITAALFPSLPAACQAAGTKTCCVIADAANSGGVAYPNCTGIPEISTFLSGESPTCRYDYTANKGPNCCMGNYDMIEYGTEQDDAGVITAAAPLNTKEVPWGGSIGNCMAGPGADDSSWPKTESGFPIGGVISYAAGGLSEEYQVESPYKLSPGVPINLSAINYHDNVAAQHTHTVPYWNGTALVNDSSTLPYAVDPIADRSGDLLMPGNMHYVFDCLDSAFEVKHRIHLRVREWNSYAGYLAYGASNGATVNSDVVGSEGATCPENIGIVGGYCNDNMDWEDTFPVISGDVSGFQTLNSVNAYAGNRYYYFPRIKRAGSFAP